MVVSLPCEILGKQKKMNGRTPRIFPHDVRVFVCAGAGCHKSLKIYNLFCILVPTLFPNSYFLQYFCLLYYMKPDHSVPFSTS